VVAVCDELPTSVEFLEELPVLREKIACHDAIASAMGSLMAEGLAPSSAFVQDAYELAEGAIDMDELIRRAVERHRT
jgi:hypothetical protein